jgi:alpha-tubulin suppressor-like RCC1 family protein
MGVFNSNTGIKITTQSGYVQDLGERYVSNDYVLDVYSNLVPGRTSPGLYVWGSDSTGSGNGKLGLGGTGNKSSPVQLGTNLWKDASSSDVHMGAIKTDGTLWTWGGNANGQLGLGDLILRSSPVQVGSSTDWKKVYAVGGNTFMIKENGTVYGMGNDFQNQLAVFSYNDYSSPIQVGSGPLTNIKQIASTGFSMLALKNDGSIYAWCTNAWGQLGLGDITNRSSVTLMGGTKDWNYISIGGLSGPGTASAGIRNNGTLWTWGSNTYGQLGNGTTTSYSSPIQIGSLTNWKMISIGHGHVLAVKTDGTLWAWGYNFFGQLGNGTTTSYSSPIQIGSLTNWKRVYSSYQQSFGIKTDGTLWAWGVNGSGQLGNGTTTNYSSPIQVGSLNSWKLTSSIGCPSGFSSGVVFILDGQI